MAYNNRNTQRNRRFNTQPEQSKRTSFLGAFFNPNLGMSLNALRETGRMFVHLIALIFAQADLIDKRHPAVLGKSQESFGLFDIINLAYQRVEWRQENFAQCAMFVAVVACIFLCGISIVYAIFAAFFAAK